MANRKIVVALGGNAILSKDASAEAQQAALRETAKSLVSLVKENEKLIITHGNGPQVGNLLLQQMIGSTKSNPAMPIDTAVSMTEGSIGYWMQNAMDDVLEDEGIDKSAATVVTQVEVDANDSAFQNPSKPIGPFYEKEDINKIRELHPEYIYVEDAGRGYRRVVPSPKPVNVREYQVINSLVDNNVIPISVGGGGVPVVREGNHLIGCEAVIDKDFASEKLAELIKADLLIILTAVDNVYINFNKPDQKKLENVTVEELENYINENQFAKGSMLPKVQAAINFVNNGCGEAVVTSLKNINNFLQKGSGTIITK
ncbi:carbamate kinase [Oenococcus oeni]|uniref:Carbamate kinase n=15 Tax=Oenococcus oeni TaxID=1247 RepID=ARCC_OENOE|nr:carbamate kinase [Oenococcus oeni]Q8VW54.1 RecName: Full=Carbamate kinase [Oenococcus oeni]AAL33872.1 carbamate kinase [Oenococcus oeni]AWW99168.1 carbamate kinase [Oenococcus oeni]EFD88037.1 hypothetical protein AWRIB429_1432 [Oenococcus oeni AWRIB429]EJN92253.1 carbamate kinase [Oenococcus oeni AWRIB304]EJO00513.1 carbamate kinase [Oenococcus oeni AWRIB419]